MDEADLKLTKSGPATVQQGDTADYILTVANLGPDTATNIVVNDILPAGMTFNAQSDNRCSLNPVNSNIVECSLATLPNGNSKAFTIIVDIDQNAQCGIPLVNNANATSGTYDPDNSNNINKSASTTVDCPTVIPEADLTLIKSGPATVKIGNTILYSLTAFNYGPDTATGAKITDNIPTGTTFNTTHSDGICSSSTGSTVTCNLNSIKSGEWKTIFIAFDVSQSIACQSTIENIASVESAVFDPNTSNNNNIASPTSATVTCDPTTFSITKSDGRTTVLAGETLTYSITVENTSDTNATYVTVIDTLPNNLEFQSASTGAIVSGSGKVITWDNLSIAAHTTSTLTLSALVPNTLNAGTIISNTSEVFGGPSTSDTTTVEDVGSPNVIITKDGPTSAMPGDSIVYTLTVNNTGTAKAENVRVTDIIPAGLVYSPGLSTNTCTQNGGEVKCEKISLEKGSSEVFTLIFGIPKTQSCNSIITNIGAVTTDGANPHESTAYTMITCPPTPTFSISKTDNRSEIDVGQTLSYTITVTNTSSVSATGVTIIDTLPSNVSYQSASNNPTRNGSEVKWENIFMNAGETRVFTVQVIVNTGTPNNTVLTNKAEVFGGPSALDTTTVKTDDDDTGEINVEVSDSPDPILVPCEDRIEYRIRIENSYNTSKSVDIVATIDADTKYISSSDGGDEESNTRIEWDNVSIPGNDGYRIIRLTVSVDEIDVIDGDTLHLNVTVDGDSDSESTRVDIVPNCGGNEAGTISLTKRADRSEAQPGSIISYNITVRNTGNTTVDDLEVIDNFPISDMTIERVEGGSVIGSTIQWNITTLPSGSSQTLHYQARLNSTLTHGYAVHNSVEAHSPDALNIPQATETVHIIKQLPQTGLNDYSDDGQAFLSATTKDNQPANTTGTAGTLGFIVWTSILSLGMTAGGILGRRFIF